MRTTIGFILPMLCLTLILQAKEPKKEGSLIGNWKLVKAQTNGRPNDQLMMNRTFKYTDDGFFEGKVIINGEEEPFNKGMYFLPNDTTMICIHLSPDNKLSFLSYTYNFHVRNDSLHLYGVYFSSVPDKPQLLQMNYINEWWSK